jgi:hypothetical protein
VLDPEDLDRLRAFRAAGGRIQGGAAGHGDCV